MSDHKKNYVGIILCSIICIGAIFLTIQRRSKRSRAELAIQQPQIQTDDSILSDQIQYQRAKQLLAQNKVLQAIQNIPNHNDTDKKNQAILWTYLAEQEIQADTLSGRQKAREYIQEADSILENIPDAESINLQEQNQAALLATCIGENQAIARYRPDIIQTQYSIQTILTEIEKLLQKANIPNTCKTDFQKSIQTNQEILISRIRNSKAKQSEQKQINRQLTNSLTCDTDTVSKRYQITNQAKIENDKYLAAQQYILSILQQNPANLIEQLCQGKNDSQLDNQLSQTMQELLDKGETQEQPASSNEVKYQDIDQDIQTIIQNTQDTNQSLIQSIQQTIHTNTYKPLEYIQKLFQQFFGNSNDFISP